MNTTLILPSGYSEALKKLLEVAKKTRFDYPKEKIILLGGLLNANPIKKDLKNLGVNIVDIPYLGFDDFIKNLDNDTIVLTSPYGCDKSLIKTLKKEHFRFFETLSQNVQKKLEFINNSKGKYRIIYIGNTNTVEAQYISSNAKFSIIFYDVNDASKAKTIITQKKFNNEKTHIIYQSELIGSSLNSSLNYLHNLLPKAIIEDEISDENYIKRKSLHENAKDSDVVIFMSDVVNNTKYLLDYYQLTTKNLLYAVIKDVKDAMLLNIDPSKHVVIVSDGSLPESIITEVYNYFTYKSMWEVVPDIHK